MGWSDGELSLTLVSDRAMARLNRETFGRRGPTNVIAFPVDGAMAGERGQGQAAPTPPPPDAGTMEEPKAAQAFQPVTRAGGPPPLLGEVVISVETTIRQAQEFGWPWQELLDFFLIHGILHLLGYHHDNPEAEAAMTARTWELMTMLHPRRRWSEK